MPSPTAFVPVGRIMGAHGIRGQVKVEVLTDFLERLEPGSRLKLDDAWIEVEKSHWHQDRLLLKLSGIDSRSDAESAYHKLLLAQKDAELDLDKDEYISQDLIGMVVKTTSGAELGTVDDVLLLPAHDVLQVGKILIPFVKQFVKDVDTRARVIAVELIDGMVE